jgi:hypothetical protein
MFKLYTLKKNFLYCECNIAIYSTPGVSAKYFFKSWSERIDITVQYKLLYLPVLFIYFIKPLVGYFARKVFRW